MSATAASFVTPRRPVAAAAFGGLIDLVKLFLHLGRGAPVVCSRCRTINRFSATVCKGCEGRLPAYYRAAGGEPGAEPAAARRWPAIPPRWATVAWTLAALVALYGVFGLWYAGHSSAMRRPAAAAQQPSGPTSPEALAVIGASQAASPAPVHAPALQPRTPATRAENERRAETPPKVAAAPRPAPTPAPAAWHPPAPASSLAQCSGLGFVARGLCMNTQCAQRANARHPQCVEALRQRRIDEARRNPVH